MNTIMTRAARTFNQENVYRLLKTNIMNLSMAPGNGLSEKDIADQLHVSRTPVREAFIRLSYEDLVEILPQKGTYVSLIDIELVNEARFLRETMEIAVLRLACSSFSEEYLFQLQACLALQELCIREHRYSDFFRHDSHMHSIIFAGCGKARTWAVIQQMSTHYDRVRLLNAAGGYELQELLSQHRELVRAIKQQDAELAKQTLNVHLNKVTIDMRQLLRDFGHFFKQREAELLEVESNHKGI